jgi:hypothetical protein
MTFNERVKHIIKHLCNDNTYAFEKSIGASNGSVKRMGEKTSMETKLKILQVYPRVRKEFLLYDQLPPFKSEVSDTASKSIDEIKRDIEVLTTENRYLKELVESLRKNINLLEKK